MLSTGVTAVACLGFTCVHLTEHLPKLIRREAIKKQPSSCSFLFLLMKKYSLIWIKLSLFFFFLLQPDTRWEPSIWYFGWTFTAFSFLYRVNGEIFSFYIFLVCWIMPIIIKSKCCIERWQEGEDIKPGHKGTNERNRTNAIFLMQYYHSKFIFNGCTDRYVADLFLLLAIFVIAETLASKWWLALYWQMRNGLRSYCL